MTFTYEVTEAGDANVRKQIVAPLIRFNESQAGRSTRVRWPWS